MSTSSDENGRGATPQEDAGVLANLPRSRPQRSSARRTAAREAAARPAAVPAPSAPARPEQPAAPPKRAPSARPAGGARRTVKAKTAAPAARKPRGARAEQARAGGDEVPRQGFEADGERTGGSIQPPGGAELVSSAAEIVGELAKAGILAGERLLKDALSLLPRS